MRYYLRLSGLIATTAFLSACSTIAPVGLDYDHPEFGNAVRQNIVAQTVNPNAPEDDSPIEANGERAAGAQERYLTDTVEAPVAISSTATVGGGGGGGAN